MRNLRRILAAAAMVGGGLALPAALGVSPAGASAGLSFQLSPCPGSGATGHGHVTISQTAKSLTIVDRITNDLPDAGQYVAIADATQQIQFGLVLVSSNGSASFEVHQTTTSPTGVNAGDSIVFLAVSGDNFVLPPLMASDSDNCLL
jgi:hypothetical protein